MSKILFVGHHGGRTGAPVLLLHFLRWLKQHTSLSFEVLLQQGGDLAAEYAELCPTFVLSQRRRSALQRVKEKLLQTMGHPDDGVAALVRRYPVHQFGLVYSNTVANGKVVAALGQAGHRIICHAHEMKFAIGQWGGESGKASVPFIREFIAASSPVKRDLTDAWSVPPEKIEIIHEFGQPCRLGPSEAAAARARVRAELGISANEILVGMCGTADWRKGADLFPLVAKLTRAQAAGRHHFLWIGSRPGLPEHRMLARDLELMGLEPSVTVMGEVSNTQQYLAALDLFLLTSREDPCPLVMLEAAASGLPIICFDRSGGAVEFVGTEAGLVVPYLDLSAMAQAICTLGDDRARRLHLGSAARARVAGGFTLETQAPKLLAFVQRHLGATR